MACCSSLMVNVLIVGCFNLWMFEDFAGECFNLWMFQFIDGECFNRCMFEDFDDISRVMLVDRFDCVRCPDSRLC